MDQPWMSRLQGVGFYVLNEDGSPVPEPDVVQWSEWHTTHVTTLAWDEIGDALVSTIFLGIDMRPRFTSDGAPVLWESVIIGGKHEGTMQRYTSRDAALHGHQLMIARVTEGWQPDVHTDADGG
jgi:hypothetical protein